LGIHGGILELPAIIEKGMGLKSIDTRTYLGHIYKYIISKTPTPPKYDLAAIRLDIAQTF
jgi:hypothetical protein